ncbi:putative leader peptide [Micromonospora sp. NBC_01796]
MHPITRRTVVIASTPRSAGVVLVSRRHIDLQRVAGALCPR